MKLILVRHGESLANAGIKGLDGINKLTPKGVEQAKKIAKDLMDQKIDAVFCSPTERCQETMEEIIKDRKDDIAIHFSKLLEPKRKIESIGNLKDRTKRFFEDLKCEFENDQTVLIITHQMPIRMFSYLINGSDLITENGSVNIFEVENQCLEN